MRVTRPSQPKRVIRWLGLVTVCAVMVSACAESGQPTTTPPVEESFSEQPSRGSPWKEMSDVDLEAKIAEAGGRVFIGFKNADAEAGVDDQGRVLASAESVAAGKAALQELGITVSREFNMPHVAAQTPAGRVTQLRQNPHIEYVEPIFPGTRN